MEKVAASITIHGIPEMTKKGRKQICDWLIRLAKDIQKEPEAFAMNFWANYYYGEGKKK